MKKEKCKQHVINKQSPRSIRGYKMDFRCVRCKKIIEKNIFPATTFEGFVRRWVHNKLTDTRMYRGKKTKYTQTTCGHYMATGNKLYYYGAGRKVSVGEDILAIRLSDGRIVGNASKLFRCGSYRRGQEAPAQRVMQNLEMPLIPFNVFEEAGLNIWDIKFIDTGKPEKLLLPKLEWSYNRHMLVPVNLWRYKEQTKKPASNKNIKDLCRCSVHYKNKKGEYKYRKGWEYQEFIGKNLEKRHFIGAMLFKIKSKKGDKYYLFDVDRRELKYYRFNAFLSEIPKPCKTIAEAYEMLKPKIVKEALKKGLKVKRQGEWFFIPVDFPIRKKTSVKIEEFVEHRLSPKKFDLNFFVYRSDNFKLNDKEIKKNKLLLLPKYRKHFLLRVEDYNKYLRKYHKALKLVHRSNPDKYVVSGTLRVGDNRPNNVTKFVELPEGTFVKGVVTHSGREHEPLDLKSWHVAVPNTATKSFTIVGNID